MTDRWLWMMHQPSHQPMANGTTTDALAKATLDRDESPFAMNIANGLVFHSHPDFSLPKMNHQKRLSYNNYIFLPLIEQILKFH
jgi:hypothetical protein